MHVKPSQSPPLAPGRLEVLGRAVAEPSHGTPLYLDRISAGISIPGR